MLYGSKTWAKIKIIANYGEVTFGRFLGIKLITQIFLKKLKAYDGTSLYVIFNVQSD